MATPTKPKTEQMDNTGLAIVADEFVGDIITDSIETTDLTVTDAEFDDSNLANPGTNAGTGPATFDKVLKITVGGTDYWIGLYDDNA